MENHKTHPYVKLAIDTIYSYTTSKKKPTPPIEPIALMGKRAGTFVSIKKSDQLRGCIGTIEPTCKTIAEEIINNAINASTQDPRFPPITEDELEELNVSVDVLNAAEEIYEFESLDPKRYGVIVKSGWKKGLLLPNLEGVDTVEVQVNIAMQKAGISVNEKIKLFRFEVQRYKV